MSTKKFIITRTKSKAKQAREAFTAAQQKPHTPSTTSSLLGRLLPFNNLHLATVQAGISFHNHKKISMKLSFESFPIPKHKSTCDLENWQNWSFLLKSLESAYLQAPAHLLISRKESTVADQEGKSSYNFQIMSPSCVLVAAKWHACCLWTRRYKGGIVWAKDIKLFKSLDGEGFSDCGNKFSEQPMLLDKIQQALFTKLT